MTFFGIAKTQEVLELLYSLGETDIILNTNTV